MEPSTADLYQLAWLHTWNTYSSVLRTSRHMPASWENISRSESVSKKLHVTVEVHYGPTDFYGLCIIDYIKRGLRMCSPGLSGPLYSTELLWQIRDPLQVFIPVERDISLDTSIIAE